MLFWEAAYWVLLLTQGRQNFQDVGGRTRMMLSLETAPSSVAELPLFDGGPYPASVRAVGLVLALFINKSDFHQVCRQFPDVALKLLAVVGRRLRHLVGVVESMTFGSVTQRLARLLLDSSWQAGLGCYSASSRAAAPCWPTCLLRRGASGRNVRRRRAGSARE
jgi:CRP/FNR family transcriptional regulator